MLRAEDRIGPYTLIRKLGQGSFGVVWLAERRSKFLTTQVALKIPVDEDPDLPAIQREAQAWLQASGHPNVLSVLDADEYDGQIVIVSEYAPDGTLADWLKKNGGKAPSLDDAINMTCGILAGLEHLHGRRMIHRDVKPGNVLLQGETPRLTDFGVSRVLKTVGSTNVAGTPAYMSPEMFDGLFSEQSDIWAVGVLFYRMLTGNLPFSQQGWGALYAAIKEDEPAPLPPSIPDYIRRVIARSLEKDPSNRYPTAHAMRLALISPLSGSVLQAKPVVNAGDALVPPKILTPNKTHSTSFPGFDAGSPREKPSENPLETPKEKDSERPSSLKPPVVQSPSGRTGSETTPRFTFWPFAKQSLPVERNNMDGAEMVWVAPGEFAMGDGDQIDNPRRRVDVEGFWIYRNLVTVAQFRFFSQSCYRTMPEAPSWGWIDDHPMVNVTWQDVRDYCRWAGVLLPNEMQWEKAARGTDGRKYPWGNGWDPNKCRCSRSNYADAGSTVSVASFPNGASPCGAFDMAGNVWEWCEERLEGTVAPGSAGGSAGQRVLRGGSWSSNMPTEFRTSFRLKHIPTYMYFTIGFRCVMSAVAS